MILSTPIDTESRTRILFRTRGHKHGPITRLMSPSDLGELLKPFVFLDIFDFDAREPLGMPLHPHSGIATVTVVAKGHFRFDDVTDGTGTLGYGGVEWMRAGGGVWHGKELSLGDDPWITGFQLWLALPSDLENGPVDSQYIEADAMPASGPARVILGNYDGQRSPVRAPAGINYLLVTLAPGEDWTYTVPEGQSQLWLAVATGAIAIDGEQGSAGEMLVVEPGTETLRICGTGDTPATFVIGSAVPHRHPLVLGYYSVHTNEQALVLGERRIEELRRRLPGPDGDSPGTSTPIFKG